MKLNISLIKYMTINESKALCLAEYHIIGFTLLSQLTKGNAIAN